MQKIMFYCQYLTGMGHLVRSTEIIRKLSKDFQVYFVNGGPPIAEFPIPDNIELINLPALWLEGGEFRIAEDSLEVDEIKRIRKNQLVSNFDLIQPDCLITEFFPFGRHKLFFELLPLLEHIKVNSPQTKIASSVRDFIGRQNLHEEVETICYLVNQYFDLILYHSDPNFQNFALTFPEYRELNCEIQATGFVAQSFTPQSRENTHQLIAKKNINNPTILVSVGGGRLGYELLESVINASRLLESQIPHHIQIFTGPFMPEELFSQLQQAASTSKNVSLQRYTNRLLEYMQNADLSISLTGYNTTMNILKTGVRAMVVPIGHYSKDQEQLMRTKKLEKLGIVEVINPEDLQPNHLAQRIVSCLDKETNTNSNNLFDLDGADNTTNILKKFLEQSQQVLMNR
ncbi:MAG: glycosyltransferase [Calothrix sp. MO_192.B10]|nr:glycosyltransferase [Calothrix sp. MO_192.B10]